VSDLRSRMDFAADLARAAGAVAMRYYQTQLPVEWKADRTPVTAADRESEKLIRDGIDRLYPHDGILGEELGERRGRSGKNWIVDPIDGTKSFLQGVPLWGVLIGLEGPEGPEMGIVYLPALDELVCAARGQGCLWNGKPAKVSPVTDLSQACFSYTSLETFQKAGPEVAASWPRLQAASRLQRGWGDCYGHVLVATGRADAMFDPVLAAWDCAPFLPILEEAGGSFTDWKGNRTIRGGSGLSTNGKLLEPVLALLRGPAKEGGGSEGKGAPLRGKPSEKLRP